MIQVLKDRTNVFIILKIRKIIKMFEYILKRKHIMLITQQTILAMRNLNVSKLKIKKNVRKNSLEVNDVDCYSRSSNSFSFYKNGDFIHDCHNKTEKISSDDFFSFYMCFKSYTTSPYCRLR